MTSDEMIVPKELLELIESGKWPGLQQGRKERNQAIVRQESAPLISRDRVRSFIPDESLIILFPPPFTPLEGKVAKAALDSFRGAPDPANPPGDLDFTRCLDIGDFGLGSDSPIVLDYRLSHDNPPVLRLRWNTEGVRFRNRWVLIASTFREFAKLLGLLE
jgi:hypothetical protein